MKKVVAVSRYRIDVPLLICYFDHHNPRLERSDWCSRKSWAWRFLALLNKVTSQTKTLNIVN